MKKAIKIVLGIALLAILIPSIFTFVAIVLGLFIVAAIIVKILGGNVNVNFNVNDKERNAKLN